MSIMQNTTHTRPTARPPNWKHILAAAKAGIWDGINCGWLNTARLDGGQVNATVGCLTAPLLRSDYPKSRLAADIRLRIEPVALAETGGAIGAEIAREIAREFADAWYDWADHFGYSFAHNVYFPSFAAYPGPIAPLTPGLPSPASPPNARDRVYKCLNDGHSSGNARLTRGTLGSRIFTALEALGALALPTAAPTAGGSSGQPTPGAGLHLAAQPLAMQLQAQPASRPGASFTPYRKTFSSPRPVVFAPVLSDLGSPSALADELGEWVQSSMARWMPGMRTGIILGQGSVPTFAPPYVPVGPVVGGTIRADFEMLSEFGIF